MSLVFWLDGRFSTAAASRCALALAIAGALALPVAGCGRRSENTHRASVAGAAKGWNVVLVSVDTLRADRLGAYGYATRDNSPHIDELIRSGVRFEEAMAARAATWPSLASVLTGLYPSGHGVLANGNEFPDELPTLPKILRRAGYQTGAFLSNMCHANHQGWDTFYCSSSVDMRATDQALAWAASLDGPKPFLLWVHYFGAHPPYFNGGARADRDLDPGYDGPVRPRKRLLDRLMVGNVPLAPRDLTHLNAIYDAAVMGTDQQVGRLMAGLAKSGRLKRTVVVFLADHGEELNQHNHYFYHACSVYQTTLHVPLALIAPGLAQAGKTVPQAVELIDVVPTLLALVGVAPPAQQDGVSLVPYLDRPAGGGAGKPAFSEYDTSRIHTVLAGGWKLVDNPDGITPICVPGARPDFFPIGKEELYNLSSDASEQQNLAREQPARVSYLREMIHKRFNGLANRSKKQQIPEERRQELRALGYVAN